MFFSPSPPFRHVTALINALGFPHRWFAEVFLRERDWGQMDLMSWAERQEKMAHELKRRDLDRFLYAPPGGESMADVALRLDRFIHLLHR